MKNIFKTFIVLSLFAVVFSSCEKENEENELHIDLKQDAGYTFSSQGLAAGSSVLLGVEAETEKANDPIIRFNISEAINSGSATTIYTEDLENTDYEMDFTYTMNDTIVGNVHTLTFTITNRDGLNKQKAIDFTVE